jgi:hypothetical protein
LTKRRMRQSRWIRIATKLGIAVALTFFLAFLGLFNVLGYNVKHIEETDFQPHYDLGYATSTVECGIDFDPVLFPYYWLVGKGQLDGNFSMVYIAEAFGPGEYGGARFGGRPQDRFDFYVVRLVTWGFVANLVLLFHAAVIVEVLGKRSLYFFVLGSIAGFAAAGIIGAIVGLFAGAFAVYYVLFRMSPENRLLAFWQSLWE